MEVVIPVTSVSRVRHIRRGQQKSSKSPTRAVSPFSKADDDDNDRSLRERTIDHELDNSDDDDDDDDGDDDNKDVDAINTLNNSSVSSCGGRTIRISRSRMNGLLATPRGSSGSGDAVRLHRRGSKSRIGDENVEDDDEHLRPPDLRRSQSADGILENKSPAVVRRRRSGTSSRDSIEGVTIDTLKIRTLIRTKSSDERKKKESSETVTTGEGNVKDQDKTLKSPMYPRRGVQKRNSNSQRRTRSMSNTQRLERKNSEKSIESTDRDDEDEDNQETPVKNRRESKVRNGQRSNQSRSPMNRTVSDPKFDGNLSSSSLERERAISQLLVAQTGSIRSSRTYRLRRLERNSSENSSHSRTSETIRISQRDLLKAAAGGGSRRNLLNADDDDDDDDSVSLLDENEMKDTRHRRDNNSSMSDMEVGNERRPSRYSFNATNRGENKKGPGKTLRQTFHALINLNPYKSETISKDSCKALSTYIKEYPQLCCETYDQYTAFPNEAILPLHMLCALGAPIPLIRQCLKANPKSLNDTTTSPLGTPFHFACMFHHFCVTNPSNGQHRDQEDATDEAYISNTLALIKFLGKMKPTGLTVPNELNQQTPLHIACMAYHSTTHGNQDEKDDVDVDDDKRSEVVNYILTVCPKLATVVDKNMNTALHIACATTCQSKYCYATVKRLSLSVDTFSVCCISPNNNGARPIHLALYNKAPYELVQHLIKANPSSLQTRDNKMRLPIHIAVTANVGEIPIFNILIDTYPDSLRETTKKPRETPYELAMKKNINPYIVQLLMISVADDDEEESEINENDYGYENDMDDDRYDASATAIDEIPTFANFSD